MGTNNIEAIVMGGSSGALEALSTLLPALPARCTIPVAIVVHLPPKRPSHLAEVLGARTVLPVREAEDKEPITAGTVYVAPPNYHLLIERTKTFALSTDEAVLFSRPAIDVLFESAADAYGARLAGIVLTGASADGARGLSAVKRRGGLAIVQSPDGAVAPEMPRAALAMVEADHVLSLTALAALLGQLATGRHKESQ
jgi:two-component system, chemotaxis family, protein-glutamate methylesterase/glutaminase